MGLKRFNLFTGAFNSKSKFDAWQFESQREMPIVWAHAQHRHDQTAAYSFRWAELVHTRLERGGYKLHWYLQGKVDRYKQSAWIL